MNLNRPNLNLRFCRNEPNRRVSRHASHRVFRKLSCTRTDTHRERTLRTTTVVGSNSIHLINSSSWCTTNNYIKIKIKSMYLSPSRYNKWLKVILHKAALRRIRYMAPMCIKSNGSLGPHESAPKTTSRSVRPFLQGSLACLTYRRCDIHADYARSRRL